MKRLLAALLLVAWPALGQVSNGWQEMPNGWGEIQNGTVPYTSPSTATLDIRPGSFFANNLTATALATPGAITVTPVLTKIGSITTVAGASLVDGDYFTIKYASGLTVPIQFDLAPGDGATGDRGGEPRIRRLDRVTSVGPGLHDRRPGRSGRSRTCPRPGGAVPSCGTWPTPDRSTGGDKPNSFR